MQPDSSKVIDIISFTMDSSTREVSITFNWIFLLVLFTVLLTGVLIWRYKLRQTYSIYDTEISISGSPSATFKIKRNTENLKIANRIYTELVTRKAALEVEEDKDVIVEIYDSWYDLFKIIRQEIKDVPGEYLKNHDATEDLIGLTLDILNKGLRPHLTTYQAKFRRWYTEATQDPAHSALSPQEIQKKYPDYPSLTEDMKKVNEVLKGYAKNLKELIKGK